MQVASHFAPKDFPDNPYIQYKPLGSRQQTDGLLVMGYNGDLIITKTDSVWCHSPLHQSCG